MSRLGSERFFREGHLQAAYLFTDANAADSGVDQTLLTIDAGFAFRLIGFAYWFRARTVGTMTGVLFALGVGTSTVWAEELEVANAVRNYGEMDGDIFFGGNGDDVIFRWTRQGGLPLPNLRGGIRIWGYRERSA